MKYAKNDNGNYNITPIDMKEQCNGASISPDGQNIIMSMPSDGDNQSTENMFVINKDNDSWSKPKILSYINDGIEDKIMPKSLNKDSKYRDYYRWVSPNDSENMNKSDKSPWNSDVWTKDQDAYYYSIFDSSMPDLNYNNPEVRKEVKNIAKKWLELGVDGFRLDAAYHIYGNKEFRKQEDKKLDCNIQWWNEFARACEEVKPDVYLVGEVWNDKDVLPQYAQPLDSKFDFTFRSNMFNAVNSGNALCDGNKNLSDKLQELMNQYNEYDTNYINAVFADNHDLDRTMSIVNNDDKAKLIAYIYLTIPGNPYIYYGEEIGMLGSGKDEDKRLPFKWNKDSSLPTTDWYYNYMGKRSDKCASIPSLEEQQNDENSMYNHYKTLLNLRKTNKALSNGSYESLNVNNKIMAYKRACDDETIYVFHNLSNEPVTIDFDKDINGEVIFTSSKNNNINNKKITIDKTSSIIIR